MLPSKLIHGKARTVARIITARGLATHLSPADVQLKRASQIDVARSLNEDHVSKRLGSVLRGESNAISLTLAVVVLRIRAYRVKSSSTTSRTAYRLHHPTSPQSLLETSTCSSRTSE